MELPPRHPPHHHDHHQYNGKAKDEYDGTLPAKLRVLVDFARHQEEHIKTLEEVSTSVKSLRALSFSRLAPL